MARESASPVRAYDGDTELSAEVLGQDPSPVAAGQVVRTIQSAYGVELDYDGSGNVIYFGLAVPGSLTSAAVWQIRKFNYSGGGNLLAVLWANGVKTFNSVWDNRTGLSYS